MAQGCRTCLPGYTQACRPVWQPYAIVDFILQSGTMNLASQCRLWIKIFTMMKSFFYRTEWGWEELLCKKVWRNGTALECNAADHRFNPARDYLYFCLRKATHVLSHETLGCFMDSTISWSVPFTVQVSKLITSWDENGLQCGGGFKYIYRSEGSFGF
jgi:hypothetical protein